ncbi:MAG: flavoprotein [Planctomycetota bacterium]
MDAAGERSRVLVGVTGGIAAYKACDLARELGHAGCDVQVVMTRAATRLVQALTFSALTGRRALVEMFDEGRAHHIDHIELARWPDVAVVAPATADFVARLANGLADELLLAVFLALAPEIPVVLCPAMNTRMWEHPVTQQNLRRLRELNAEGYKYTILDPVAKRLACGEEGMGALPPVEQIVAAVRTALAGRKGSARKE